MRMLMTWARSAIVVLVLGGASFAALSQTALADVSVSQSNDPTASVDTRLRLLLGQERTAFTAVSADRLEQIVTPPPSRTGHVRAVPGDIKYSDAWLASLPRATGGEQWTCLAEALYFEARGESVKGEFAVAR